MSNAKRRHRRRWYRQQRAAAVLRIERDLAARGYELTGSTGAERIWTRRRTAEELRKHHPIIRDILALPAFALEMEWVEVP